MALYSMMWWLQCSNGWKSRSSADGSSRRHIRLLIHSRERKIDMRRTASFVRHEKWSEFYQKQLPGHRWLCHLTPVDPWARGRHCVASEQKKEWRGLYTPSHIQRGKIATVTHSTTYWRSPWRKLLKWPFLLISPVMASKILHPIDFSP
jgi:hypothetical protein